MSDDEPAEAAADAADADEGASEDDADEQEDLSNGDFVRIDYTLRTVDDDRVVDTTLADVAEDAELETEDREFSPRTMIVGAGHVFEAVDREIEGSEVGDSGSVEIPPEEAFGVFDPDDVRTVSAEKIDEDSRYPGARVRVDGQQGHVETVVGGRARIDFNHPLAGETIAYEYEIVDRVDDPVEQARGLLGIHLQDVPDVRIQTDEVEEEVPVESGDDEDADADGEPEFETQTVEKRTLYIEATPRMAMNQQWLFQKNQIAQELMGRLDLDRVVIEEVIDGSGGGMGGLMGGMGGMGGAPADVEEALEDADVDADEIVEEIDDAAGE